MRGQNSTDLAQVHPLTSKTRGKGSFSLKSECRKVVSENGSLIEYFDERGRLHNPKGPAKIENTGSYYAEFYYNHGVLHNNDRAERGAAVSVYDYENEIFRYEYYENGLMSRDDGPAVIEGSLSYDSKEIILKEEYMKNGLLHRQNEPASIAYDYSGSKVEETFYVEGKRHNENGPAAIVYDLNGNLVEEIFYVEDKKHNENGPAYIDHKNDVSVFYVEDKKHNDNGPAYIDRKENIVKYFREDLLHRDPLEGPALTYFDYGYKVEIFYVEGKKHNENGPAVIKTPIEKDHFVDAKPFLRCRHEYFLNDVLDREGDQPAVIEFDVKKEIVLQEYYDNGLLHRDENLGPAVISFDKEIFYDKGLIHRSYSKGPAINRKYASWPSGKFEYYKHGLRHRPIEEGPAVIYNVRPGEFWVENDYKGKE